MRMNGRPFRGKEILCNLSSIELLSVSGRAAGLEIPCNLRSIELLCHARDKKRKMFSSDHMSPLT